MSNINKNGTWNTGEIINEKNYTNLLTWVNQTKTMVGINFTFQKQNMILNGTCSSTVGANVDDGYIQTPTTEYEIGKPYIFYMKYLSGSVSLKEGGTATTNVIRVFPALWSGTDSSFAITLENYQETKYAILTLQRPPSETVVYPQGLRLDFWKDYIFDNLTYECGIIQSDTLNTNIEKVKIFNNKIEAVDFIEI